MTWNNSISVCACWVLCTGGTKEYGITNLDEAILINYTIGRHTTHTDWGDRGEQHNSEWLAMTRAHLKHLWNGDFS